MLAITIKYIALSEAKKQQGKISDSVIYSAMAKFALRKYEKKRSKNVN